VTEVKTNEWNNDCFDGSSTVEAVHHTTFHFSIAIVAELIDD
jgi:hypothetical protein